MNQRLNISGLSKAEAQWMREAWSLIAAHHDVDRVGDRADWRIDGMTVTDGQVCELAISLGKRATSPGLKSKKPRQL